MNTTQMTVFLGYGNRMVAVNPTNGLVLRDATIAEVEAYMAQPVAYRNALKVGAVLIDESAFGRPAIDQGGMEWA